MKALTRERLEYAEHDLYAARLLAESHKPPFKVINYHCQQSAEKSTKALLIEHVPPLPRTHDMGIYSCGRNPQLILREEDRKDSRTE